MFAQGGRADGAEEGTLDGMVLALVVTLVAAILLLVVVWAFQRWLIYFPSTSPVPPAARMLDGAQDVTLQTDDGLRLGAWYAPTDDTRDGVTVLVASGNGGDRAMRTPLARALTRRGLGVLLFDYRGYGGNPGSPAEDGLALDVRAARRFLVEDAGIPPERLVYFGESLGAAVVTELAAVHPPAALVLRSPFVDLASVGRHHYPYLPVRLLLRDRYPLMRHLERVQVPVVVVYGTGDTVVPAEHSLTVARAAPGPTRTLVLEGVGHNDPALVGGEQVADAVGRAARRVA